MKIKIILKILIICFTLFIPQWTYSENFGKFEKVGELSLNTGDNLTEMNDGRVLISSGCNAFEIYNPQTNKIEDIPQPKYKRGAGCIPIVLNDGRIFLPGTDNFMVYGENNIKNSYESEFSEIFDPKTNTYSLGPKMNISRTDYGITKLKDGKILIIDGQTWKKDNYHKNSDNSIYFTPVPVFKAEIYNPDTNKFELIGETVSGIKDNYVNINGKEMFYRDYLSEQEQKPKVTYPQNDLRNKLASQDKPKITIYDKRRANLYNKNSLKLLPNGDVLIWSRQNAELFNPQTNTFRKISTVVLPNNGLNKNSAIPIYFDLHNNLVLFEPETENFITSSKLSFLSIPDKFYIDRDTVRFIKLADGNVLIYNFTIRHGDIWKTETILPLDKVLIYDPSTDKFFESKCSQISSKSRLGYGSLRFKNGNVLIIGSKWSNGKSARICYIYKNIF